ncbi:draxin [Amia ocellicauda]|uniref:draxin n=1 Tax=Amia ocellicauda TaxID=2972642 RepID=UPI003463C175
MAVLSWCRCATLLLATLVLSDSAEPGSRNVKKALAQPAPGGTNTLQSLELWPQRSGQHRRHGGRKDKASAGLLSRGAPQLQGRPEDDGMGLEGLSPVRLEMGPGERRVGAGERRGSTGDASFLGFGIPFHERDNHPPGSEGSLKGRRHGHHLEHKKHGGRKDKARHAKVRLPEPELGSVLKEGEVFEEQPPSKPPSESAAPPTAEPTPTPGVSPSTFLVTTVARIEELPVLPPASTKPQRIGHSRARAQGEVMPTLDMALFDWTDYEDMKPVDTWPSLKKKEKRRSKNLSNVNMTVESEAMAEPCDHHLDCLPGSCCDLRQHVCKPHNRGLNNKCYDDCMCEEGLRCYAKFHRNRRVTRRRGRCVDPESANSDQGSFITV